MRTAKFVARKQWIVCGSDDMFVRVYNYNTMDKVKSFEAHTDYIRSIAVHPTQPYLLTCSDDMLIKLWDWDKVCRVLMLQEKGRSSMCFLTSVLYTCTSPGCWHATCILLSLELYCTSDPSIHSCSNLRDMQVDCYIQSHSM